MRQATTCLPGQGPERALVVAGEPAKARELSEAALDDRSSPRRQHRAAFGPRVLDHLGRMPRAFAAQAGSSPAYGWKKIYRAARRPSSASRRAQGMRRPNVPRGQGRIAARRTLSRTSAGDELARPGCSSLGPSPCPYSAECVEEKFSEVHLQDPAYPGL
jgi:hypothetical protein